MNNDPRPPKDEHHSLAVWILIVLAVIVLQVVCYLSSEGNP